mmetsp:Transcript_11828/g.21867  ORF Transcript_11828/g.21867 Transcript_11828/m.21867 type:complete len:383 (+) Transcript_11828:167-1315(+)
MSANGYTTQYGDTAYRINPQPPLEEVDIPKIERCVTKPQDVVVLPPDDVDDMSFDPQDSTRLPCVEVMKAENATQAYMKIQKQSKSLGHHAPNWGCVYFGIVLPRVGDGVFQCPKPEDAQHVAIKRLTKIVVDTAIRQGKRENPYNEIRRMQRFGDNRHVLGLVEALEDDQYLYIIMPYCEQGSLVERIPWRKGVQEDAARSIFLNILENMIYLHERGICHRDLSPDNCMVLNGRVVFNDLAMSFRIPNSGHVLGMGGFGKPAYLPPEVCVNLPFDAKGCDLWSAAVILFNLVTGEVGWTEPFPGNLLFRYFLLAGGLSRSPANERTVEILMDEPAESPLKNLVRKCLSLSPEVLDLIEGMLKISADERWNIDQVLRSSWIR